MDISLLYLIVIFWNQEKCPSDKECFLGTLGKFSFCIYLHAGEFSIRVPRALDLFLLEHKSFYKTSFSFIPGFVPGKDKRPLLGWKWMVDQKIPHKIRSTIRSLPLLYEVLFLARARERRKRREGKRNFHRPLETNSGWKKEGSVEWKRKSCVTAGKTWLIILILTVLSSARQRFIPFLFYSSSLPVRARAKPQGRKGRTTGRQPVLFPRARDVRTTRRTTARRPEKKEKKETDVGLRNR